MTPELRPEVAEVAGESHPKIPSPAQKLFTVKSLVVAVLSLSAGLGLVALLFRLSRVHLSDISALLQTSDRRAFVVLCILFAFNSYLSAEKWRLARRALSHREEALLRRSTAFSLTSLGVALGQVLPIQISTSIARTIGTWAEGRAVRRGTIGTLFEQAFDFVILCAVMMATLVARVLRPNAFVWTACSCIALLLTIVACPWMTRLMRFFAARLVAASGGRYRELASDLLTSGLLQGALARKLAFISSVRFVVLAFMVEAMAIAIHSKIPMWQLAASIPFSMLAAVAGITPGGLGLSEFASTGILAGFGTSISSASEWALASRVLTFAAAFVVAAFGAFILGLHHWRGIAKRD